MRQLMISLDKNILDSRSNVVGRISKYGRHDEIFIIVPASEKRVFDLKDSSIHISSTGGSNKLIRFFRILTLGRRIIKEKRIEEITSQDPFFTGLAGIFLRRGARKSGNKVILEIQVHGDFFNSQYYRGWRTFLGKWVIRHADKIRVAGERVKNSLLDLKIAERIITVRPIQSMLMQDVTFTPKFDLHEKYGHDKKIFLSIGRLDKVKNLSWLVDVFEQVASKKAEALLLIVGSGVEENFLKEKVRALGLENRIKFENWTDDPLSYIKTADCLVISSLSEGYGLTAVEAAALGTPVIMTDVGVANFELKPEPKIKILSIGDKEGFVQTILEI